MGGKRVEGPLLIIILIIFSNQILQAKNVFKIKLPNKKGTEEIGSVDNGPDDNSLLDKSQLDKNKDAYQTGLVIANVITYFWNSQKNPGFYYVQWKPHLMI